MNKNLEEYKRLITLPEWDEETQVYTNKLEQEISDKLDDYEGTKLMLKRCQELALETEKQHQILKSGLEYLVDDSNCTEWIRDGLKELLEKV